MMTFIVVLISEKLLPFSPFEFARRYSGFAFAPTQTQNKKRNIPMIKKAVFALLFALALTVSAPIASADVDFPECYPCDTK